MQLGAFPDPTDALKAKTERSVALSGILRHDNHLLTIVASKSDGLSRVVFAQAFPTPEAAALCAAIKARGPDCSVTRAWPLPDKAAHGLHVAEARDGRGGRPEPGPFHWPTAWRSRQVEHDKTYYRVQMLGDKAPPWLVGGIQGRPCADGCGDSGKCDARGIRKI